MAKGLKLRERLIPVIATFKNCIMYTLTVDPKQFDSPQQAHEYLKSKRCFSKWIADIRRDPRNKLHSDRFFCVKEFQQHTEMVHYHVLLDAQYVDIEAAREAWAKHVPTNYIRPADDKSPLFGHVRFSKGDFKNRIHAARYASKYLLKIPEYGWPDWVLNSKKRIVRYTTSRGFWPEVIEEEKPKEITEPKIHTGAGECEPTCFCRLCREQIDEPEVKTTVIERIHNCRTKTALIKETEVVYSDGEIRTNAEYVESFECSPIKLAEFLGLEAKHGKHFYVNELHKEALAVADIQSEINEEHEYLLGLQKPPDD